MSLLRMVESIFYLLAIHQPAFIRLYNTAIRSSDPYCFSFTSALLHAKDMLRKGSLLLSTIYNMILVQSGADSSDEVVVACTDTQNIMQRYTVSFIQVVFMNYKRNIQITPKYEGNCEVRVQCKGENIDYNENEKQYKVKDCETPVEIYSQSEVTVHGLVYTAQNELTGGFLALPHQNLGTEYLLDCYGPKSDHRAQFVISAIENDTTIWVQNTTSLVYIGGNFSNPFLLDAGQEASFKTEQGGADLTGTYITSSRPIAVIVGSSGVIIPHHNEFARNPPLDFGIVIEQLLPMSAWGYTHIVPPFRDSTNGWVIRVMANHRGSVQIKDCGNKTGTNYTLNKKEIRNITVDEGEPHCILISDVPIQVVQYMRSSTIDEPGDTSMVVVPPIQDFHGNTNFRIKNERNSHQYVDVIFSKRSPPWIEVNNDTLDIERQTCFNFSDFFGDVKTYCNRTIDAGSKRLINVTQSGESESFSMRYYVHSDNTGAAMLIDISPQRVNRTEKGYTTQPDSTSYTATEPILIGNATTIELASTGYTTPEPDLTSYSTTEPVSTGSTERKSTSGATLVKPQTSQARPGLDLHGRLNQMIENLEHVPVIFRNFTEAEDVLKGFVPILGRSGLGSPEDVDVAFGFMHGVLRRRPLNNATATQAQSFLNLTSNAINVIFDNSTNKLLDNACRNGSVMNTTAEDVQRELEGLMTDATRIIVDGGLSSFGISLENAAIDLSSTDDDIELTTPTTPRSVSDDTLRMTSYDVHIPSDVLREQGARAVYRLFLPHAAEAIAMSHCRYNPKEESAVSPLLSVGLVSDLPPENFSSNISLSFSLGSNKNLMNVTDTDLLCSFWNYADSDWSQGGCILKDVNITGDYETKVTCLCDHLTSFAVILKVSPDPIPEYHEEILSKISYIGCGCSIIGCFITVCGYAILKLRSDLIMIHGNLALALCLAEITFLCLNVVTHPSVSCTVVAAFLYYFLVATFSWMAIEGIHLYLLTFVVWNAEKKKIKYYLPLGWGIPVILVTILLVENEGKLGYDKACFLKPGISGDDKSLLYFLVPVCLVIVLNVFVTSRVVYQISTLTGGPARKSDVPTRVKQGLRALVLLLPIMGLTWAFAFLAVENALITFLYIFVILNSLQGAFIFIVHFVRNLEVQQAIQRKKRKWLASHSRLDDYRVKKTSSTGNRKLTTPVQTTAKTPDQTMTLANMHAD